jgi:polysaccharide pyruvyl transferase WcaK-like protein
MRVGLVGYYGYANAGDEWFMQTWREALRPHEAYAVSAWDDLGQYARFVIGGGDLLVPDVANSHYWREAFLAAAPVAVYGVGLPDGPDGGPLAWDPEAVAFYRGFLARCGSVSARDYETGGILRAWGLAHVRDVPDMAWAAPLPRVRLATDPDRPWVGLSLRPTAPPHPAMLVSFCRRVLEAGLRPLLVPLQPSPHRPWRDDTLHEALRRLVPEAALVPPDFDMEHRLAAIGACAFYVGSRFHGLMAAARYGVPWAALSASRKFRTLAALLGLEGVVCGHDMEALALAFEAWRQNPACQAGARPHVAYLEALAVQRLREFAAWLTSAAASTGAAAS